MILILPNIILVIDPNPLKHPSPANPPKPNPIHTKILYTNILNIANSLFINVDNNKSPPDLFIEVRVENFEIEPLVETDCICVIGQD